MAERQTTQRPAPSPPPSASTAVAAPVDGPSGPRAGFFRRLAALVIDGALLSAVSIALLFLLQQGLVVLIVANILVALAYYALLEGGMRGQTLGKRALGIRVVDLATGEPIGYGRGAVRYFARYLSSLPLWLGYLWVFVDREKQTWHDKLARSVVVPATAYPFAAARVDASTCVSRATER